MQDKNFTFRKIKYILMGIVIGITFMLSAIVFANNEVAAVLFNNVTFYFNGEAKALPQGYEVLNYNGRVYTPARFIAEELGGKVEWDEDTKSIYITYEEKAQEICPPTQEKPEVPEIPRRYSRLPVHKASPDIQVIITTMILEDNQTIIYLELEGRSNDPYQLLQSATVIETGNKTYKQKDLKNIVDPIDVRWYHDIRKDQRVSGWIKMPPIPKDTKELTLYLQTVRNDGSNQITNFEFDISL